MIHQQQYMRLKSLINIILISNVLRLRPHFIDEKLKEISDTDLIFFFAKKKL